MDRRAGSGYKACVGDAKKQPDLLAKRIAEFLHERGLVTEIARILEREGYTMHDAGQALQALKAREEEFRKKRGPQPGTGGRPRMGAEKRAKLGFSVDADVARWIEEQRRPGENFSQTMERLLRQLMGRDGKVNRS